ncbi:hypothetical protein, partial [Mycobacterium timonense]
GGRFTSITDTMTNPATALHHYAGLNSGVQIRSRCNEFAYPWRDDVDSATWTAYGQFANATSR